MEEAEKELERRSKFLNSLIQQKKKAAIESEHEHESSLKVDVRACDMPLPFCSTLLPLATKGKFHTT